MTPPAQRISAYVLKDLVRKLSPERLPGMPPTLVELTGFILGARFCRPYITAVVVVVTDSGIVLARANGDTVARHVLGSYSDVLRNWMRLISTAGLSPHEVHGSTVFVCCEGRVSRPNQHMNRWSVPHPRQLVRHQNEGDRSSIKSATTETSDS